MAKHDPQLAAFFQHRERFHRGPDDSPLVLTVPGLGNSGPDHWQTRWEKDEANVRRVDLGEWDEPRRNNWVNRLNMAIHRADRPVVLVAHSLGCHALAWWVEYEAFEEAHNVIGALLVAPPEVEEGAIDPRLSRFAPVPQVAFPFPSIVVASRNDPYVRFARARAMAEAWGSRFADAGAIGHINAASDLGDWSFGRFLVHQLKRRSAAPEKAPAAERRELVA